jgi:hypothetical protein
MFASRHADRGIELIGSPGVGIEVENDAAASPLREADGVVILIGALEVGGAGVPRHDHRS